MEHVSESLKTVVIIYSYLAYMDYFAYFDYLSVFSKGSIMKRRCQGIKAIRRRRLPKIGS